MTRYGLSSIFSSHRNAVANSVQSATVLSLAIQSIGPISDPSQSMKATNASRASRGYRMVGF
jgi:hypothetical protein